MNTQFIEHNGSRTIHTPEGQDYVEDRMISYCRGRMNLLLTDNGHLQLNSESSQANLGCQERVLLLYYLHYTKLTTEAAVLITGMYTRQSNMHWP